MTHDRPTPVHPAVPNTPATSGSLQRTLEDGVLTLTLDRPEVRNALDVATYDALTEALRHAATDDATAVVILRGAGGHFTAGNDLRDFQRPRGTEDSAGLRFLRTLAACPRPVIAAVEGSAVGVGVTLLLHCDFVIAAGTARFRLPFVPLGLCPEGASSVLLARFVGPRKAADWMLRGRGFDGGEAHAAGLITSLVAEGQAFDAARSLASELAALPREALAQTKNMLARDSRADVQAAFDHEKQHFAERLRSDEAQQAFARFLRRDDAPATAPVVAPGAAVKSRP